MTEWISREHPHAVELRAGRETANKISVDPAAILAFFGFLSEAAHNCDTINVNSTTLKHAPLGVSTIGGYKSALVDLYRDKSLKLDPDLNGKLRDLLDGYEKTINSLKQRGLMEISEGKKHLKSSGYDLSALKLMGDIPKGKGQSWSAVVFSWAYFVIMWNLMSRSDSVDKIMLQHLDWAEDALTIEEQGHKGDQTGADKYGKHIYANPFEPAKCPILVLAVLMFTSPERLDGRQQLFIGSDNKNRFGRSLRKIVGKLSSDELRLLGSDTVEDIGYHSVRKGSSTYALSQVSGPTPVSVYLRMGQSLGKLKDRYIFFGEGADQLCGRMVAGLPFDSVRFGVLPPHFEPALGRELTLEYWQEIISGFNRFPTAFQSAFPFLLASVIYHETFLRQSLSDQHPIFKARVFTNNRLLDRLRGSVVLSIGTSPACALKATGIPPHLAIASQLQGVVSELESVKSELTDLKATFASSIVDAVSTKVASELRESLVIEGVVPLATKDLELKINSLRKELLSDLEGVLSQLQPRNAVIVPPRPEPSQWNHWDWGDGKLPHAVPFGWEFPSLVSVKSMWDLWFFGDKNPGIRPYKAISQEHDVQPKHRMRITRARGVMSALLKIIIERSEPNSAPNISSLCVERSDELFSNCFPTLLADYDRSKPQRAEEISYGTVYNS